MLALLKKIFAPPLPPPIPHVEPDPPPWDVPLDQTTAPIHFEGDTNSI
jgi:hypothetical protein